MMHLVLRIIWAYDVGGGHLRRCDMEDAPTIDKWVPVVTSGDSDKATGEKKRIRPTKTLPTDRITFSKQLEILRAFGILGGASGTPTVVTNKEVAEVVKMQPSTVSLANPFFVSINFLQKAEDGCSPAAAVMDMIRAKEWTPETAMHKLAPPLRESWFGAALLPKLSFAPMTEESALAKLAEACTATPEYKPQLRMLVDFLVVAGLVEREGDQLKASKPEGVSPIQKSDSPSKVPERERSQVTTGFAQTPEGAVNFHISIRVEMAEFAGWKSDRIAAFFNGIAAVLAAKANVEQSG